MAEDHKVDSLAEAKKFAWFVVFLVAALLGLWYYSGGPERSDLRGIFIKPLPPVDTGESYGPTIGPRETNTSN